MGMVHRGHSVRTRQTETRPSRSAQMKCRWFVGIAVLAGPRSSVADEVRARREDVVYLSETGDINSQRSFTHTGITTSTKTYLHT